MKGHTVEMPLKIPIHLFFYYCFCFLLIERYYCCYYPESEEFRERVASIVNYFRENGYNVIMDRMVSEEITSQGPTRWGENQIRRAKKVLIFLSPGLVNLALDNREDSQCQVYLFMPFLRRLFICVCGAKFQYSSVKYCNLPQDLSACQISCSSPGSLFPLSRLGLVHRKQVALGTQDFIG